MKKLFKYLLVVIIMFISPCLKKVYGATYNEQFNDSYLPIPNIFITKVEPDTSTHYLQLAVVTRKSDNQFVYCMEINELLYTDQDYIGQDYNQLEVSNVTANEWKRIQLLAYYGYGYHDGEIDHTDLKWYAITQYMIWCTVPHGWKIYFTDTLNGSYITPYNAEIQEMETLLANHDITPDFGDIGHDITIGNKLSLTDKNNVLTKYDVSSSDNVLATKDTNQLNIVAKNVGNATITLTKRDSNYSHPTIIYPKVGGQDMVQVGSYDPIETNFNLNIIGGKITLNKLDYDTGLASAQGDATLNGAVYGLYKEDGSLIEELITNENGYAQSNYLPSTGRYYLQEITPSKGYELDLEKYYFDLQTNNLYPNIKVKEKVIKREYSITKVVASNKTQVLTPEANIEFGIYNKNNQLISKYTTDNQGKITFTLPYGHYILRQLTTPVGYEKLEDFEFEITESGPTINKVFSNAEITARVKVLKVDENGKSIAKSGIKFKIKDLSNNDYVCQTIYYPNHQTYCEFSTDENGILITPYPLNSGNYELEEVDQAIEGYLWNSKPLKFSINEKSDFKKTEEFDSIIELKFTNVEVKGKIEIQKLGESVVIEDGKFIYEEVPLPNIVFGLYDELGNFINSYTTNNDGQVIINNLKLVKYFIKELETADGFVLDNIMHEIDLKYIDQYTPIVTESFSLKNYLKKGKLEFSKSDLTSGKEIPNVKIEVFTEDNELIYSGITDEKGNITIEHLFAGKFYIIETEPATGYKLNNEKVYFEIKEDGQVVKATMTNEKIKGNLEFTKEDLTTGNPLPNALIEIHNINDELIFSGKTDENGKIIIKELEYGKYYILEKTAPEGYVLNEEKVYFEILEDGKVVKATMTNEKIKGDLEFTKIDLTTGSSLPNALIEIYNDNDELIFSGKTNKNGKIIVKNLEYGKYYILEKEAPEGYVLNEEKMYFEIKENGKVVKAEMTNEKITGTLEFTKEDLSTGKALPNTLIEIYNENNELIFSGRTNEEGKIIIKELEYGKYYIIEKEPSTGYKLTNEKVYFEIKEDGQIVKATMTNEKIKGDLEFTKKDLTTGNPLPNALIEIYNDNDELIFSGKTNKNGKIIVKNLEYGKYYILEKEAPEGYVLNNEKVYFEILEDGKVVKAEMTNEKITGTLEFTKKDLSTGEPLPNTLIEIYNKNDELIFSGRTDEEGKIIIENLEYGKYYIIEKEAPEGYVLNNEKMYFEIKEDGEVIQATMTNEKEEMPDTYNTDLATLLTINGSAILGLIFIAYGKKRH